MREIRSSGSVRVGKGVIRIPAATAATRRYLQLLTAEC
jgi:hypothetical protein